MRKAGEEVETTWEEHSEFQKDLKLNITVSEFDCEPKVAVFQYEQNIVNKVHGSDCSATNFLSQFHINTHQGNNTQCFCFIHRIAMKKYFGFLSFLRLFSSRGVLPQFCTYWNSLFDYTFPFSSLFDRINFYRIHSNSKNHNERTRVIHSDEMVQVGVKTYAPHCRPIIARSSFEHERANYFKYHNKHF